MNRPGRTGSIRSHLVTGLATLVMLGSSACATNPATGGTMLSLVSESQEIQMGQEYMQQVEATMPLLDNLELEAYVNAMGQDLAAISERPDLPWSFKIVDDPVVNAFALPGGPVYLTRGILGYFSSEAEMASVLGHEIGHITARHSVEQISRQQLMGLGLLVGAIASPVVRQNLEGLSMGLQVLFLSYGRDDEHQSDMLGVRYALKSDYDVTEAVTMHEKLGRLSAQTAEAGGGIPSWLSTHPSSADRVQRIQAIVDTVSPANLEGVTLGRDEYLRKIDGLMFGENPREGYFQASGRFVHPDLAFRLDYPSDWQKANMPQQVVALSPAEDAIVQLMLASGTGHAAAAREFFEQEGLTSRQIQRVTVNGNPATVGYFQAQTENGVLEGLAGFLDYDGRTFRILGYTVQGKLRSYDSVFRGVFDSFARLTDRAALNAQPMRIDIIRVDNATTIAQLSRSRGSPVAASELAIVNGIDVNDTIPADTLIKWVVGQKPPGS